MPAKRAALAVLLAAISLAPAVARAEPSCVRPPPTSGEDDAPACAAAARRAVEATLAKPGAGPDAREPRAAAGRAAMEAFDAFCRRPIAAGAAPRVPGCDALAFDAARAFQAGGRSALAITAAMAVVEHEQRTGAPSSLGPKATFEIARGYEGLAAYELAAEWYERAAQRSPSTPEGEAAAKAVVILRLGLGEAERAVGAAAAYVKAYGGSQPASAASVAFVIGAWYEQRGEHAAAVRHLSQAMATIDRGPVDVRAGAHATLARAVAATEGPKSSRAANEYASVLALVPDASKVPRAIEDAWPGEDQPRRDRRLAHVLNAEGEALFFTADARRGAEVAPLAAPLHKRGESAAALSAWATKDLRPWADKRQRAIELVEQDFVKILELKPVPPPKWVVAAAAAVGVMWGDFADDLRKRSLVGPLPRDPALRAAYESAVQGLADPIVRQRALPAMKKCVDLAAKLMIVDERVKSCEAWLVENDDAHFRRGGEIAPRLRAGAPPEQGAPLRP